jgi:16S rRNA (cytidine1402-2'-O)-methyltransferase
MGLCGTVNVQAMVAETPGTLYVVATPIGNLDDISQRALKILAAVDAIAAEDTRHSGRLLAHFGIGTAMVPLHEHNERAASAQILQRLASGQSVALVSDAGTPLISDPGFQLVRACRQAGFAVVAIPGPNALIAALSVAGLPTDRFRFEGFLPRKPPARRALLGRLLADTATLAFYESSHRILETLRDLVEVFGGARRAVLARELTKLHETVLALPLGELLRRVEEDQDQRRGEIVLLVAGSDALTGEIGELDRVLAVLLEEVGVKQAAHLAARLTGTKRNRAYQRALELSGAERE